MKKHMINGMIQALNGKSNRNPALQGGGVVTGSASRDGTVKDTREPEN